MATRIADNPKIWRRLPSSEDRPEDRPEHMHEYDNSGLCKVCGVDVQKQADSLTLDDIAPGPGLDELLSPWQAYERANVDRAIAKAQGQSQSQRIDQVIEEYWTSKMAKPKQCPHGKPIDLFYGLPINACDKCYAELEQGE